MTFAALFVSEKRDPVHGRPQSPAPSWQRVIFLRFYEKRDPVTGGKCRPLPSWQREIFCAFIKSTPSFPS